MLTEVSDTYLDYRTSQIKQNGFEDNLQFLERISKGYGWQVKWLSKRLNKQMEGLNNELGRITGNN